MASISNRIPKPPFFFRIFSPDGQGIMYKAATKLEHDAYECHGSRQIDTTSDGVKIWLIGGYSDVMPWHQIVDKSIYLKKKTRDLLTIIALTPH